MENFNLPPTYQNNNNDVLRAALYIRVSTAEQAMHGYSIDAQKEFLEAYAKENKMRIVGVYCDEGKSASKRLYQRTELTRMIADMEAGLIDVILFKDITRWSRNSSHYYRIQDKIDAAGAYWIAVQQPYLETKTPTGRFQVTVMLGNAQLEAEQTSERIKFVNQSRIPKGGVPYGEQSCPPGYTVKEVDGIKRMVKDPATEEIVKEFFKHYFTYQTKRGVMRHLYEKFGYKLQEKSIRKMLKNTLYMGEYKGVPNYCEPYITKEEFSELKRIQNKREYVKHEKKRVYIFSSLTRCAECGRNLGAYLRVDKGISYLYYRCKNHANHGTCEHKKGLREDRLEQWMLENIESEMCKYIQRVKIEQAAPPPDNAKKRKTLERKIKNLRELYIDGDIDKTEYTRRKSEYEQELADLPVVEIKDTKDLEDFLNSNWREIYDTLDPHEKRAFWRSIVNYIVVDKDLNKTPHFFE